MIHPQLNNVGVLGPIQILYAQPKKPFQYNSNTNTLPTKITTFVYETLIFKYLSIGKAWKVGLSHQFFDLLNIVSTFLFGIALVLVLIF